MLGGLAERFWKANGWRRLGYATESQYVRERLGMSLSSVKAKRALARRAEKLCSLREAIERGILGYEAARLVSTVANEKTATAWIDRARERTVLHLREEVDAVHMLARVGIDRERRPPTEATMAEVMAWESRVLSGRPFGATTSQMSAAETEPMSPDLPRVRPLPGRCTLRVRVHPGTRRFYRWVERTFRRSGPRHVTFVRFLCTSLLGVWRTPPSHDAFASVYERDRHRCTNPVCGRRDVTPHHLRFRSRGGDDSAENVTTLCVWCHLEGVHGGRIAVAPPASAMTWRLGRKPHTIVVGRRRIRASGGGSCRDRDERPAS
jgi:hypothetical protein